MQVTKASLALSADSGLGLPLALSLPQQQWLYSAAVPQQRQAEH